MTHMAKKNIIIVTLVFLIVITGCDSSSALDRALDMAGDNRIELEKVLEHFKDDSLKYKAAVFLIENMPYQCGVIYEDTTRLYAYYRAVSSSDIDPWRLCDSISNADGQFNPERKRVQTDLTDITSSFLIEHINTMFKAWMTQPWRNKIDFDTFCNHILPYRLRDEPLIPWARTLYERYNPVLDSLRNSSDSTDMRAAATIMLRHLQKQNIVFTHAVPQGVNVGVRNVEWKIGDCKEFADILTWVLRSLAIPCGCDMMLVRGDNNVPHYWNYILDNDGQSWYGSIGYADTEYKAPDTYWNPKGKVWRECYALNSEIYHMLHAKTDAEFIHPSFRYPTKKDVTSLYANPKCRSFDISADKLYRLPDDDEPVYLCMSSSDKWIPVDIVEQKCDSNIIRIKNIEGDVVFRVATALGDRLNFIAPPFLVDRQSGRIHWYDVIPEETEQVCLLHKFNLRTEPFGQNMVGGIFEGSNNADFNQCDTLHVIKEFPDRLYNRAYVLCSNVYRYVRYRGVKSGSSDISELTFMDHNGASIKGEPICNINEPTMNNAFDGDPYTSFRTEEKEAWIGLKFKNSSRISSIVFTPRNRKNYIQPGNRYELFYCDKDWISLGVKHAQGDSLLYDVPRGALLFLRNHTEGNQERIFEYSNGKQKWW